ncbi:MAG TPA: flippase activity-associated protein Agl23 [Thermoanaerobaculia bacterium]|nr:flippase activity-associated protein Agl23 [Thermoanaerobaculia bacterium]
MRWLPFWTAFAVALLLRLLSLDLAPLHHDEGVNAWFMGRLLGGIPFKYDPAHYHGPFLYYMLAPLQKVFGTSPTALRMPVAFVSALLVPLLVPLRRRLGLAGITGAAWLIAVSPSLVYYGRDLIHETFLVFFTLALLVSASLFLETRREHWLLLASACLASLFTIKETAALTVGTLVLALALASRGEGEKNRLRRWGITPGGALRAALVFGAVYILFFSSFFANRGGIADSFRAYLLWVGTGVKGAGHEKPWTYFLEALLRFETLALLGAVLGGALAFRRRHVFGMICALWTAGQLAVYSVIPYKTPWLVLNIVLPAALTSGVFVQELARRPLPGWVCAALTGGLILALAVTAARAIQVSFLRYDDDRLMIVYVPSHRDFKKLVAQVHEAAARAPAGDPASLKIFTKNLWPMPWYFRDFRKARLWDHVPSRPDGDILIFDPKQERLLRSHVRQRYNRYEYFLRPRLPLVVYVAERLWEDERR